MKDYNEDSDEDIFNQSEQFKGLERELKDMVDESDEK